MRTKTIEAKESSSMGAINCLRTRRSIRRFKDKDVSEKLVEIILDCARRAPSSCNCQPWEFVVVRDQNLRQKLSGVHKWCCFIVEAPVNIVVCVDQKKFNFQPSSNLLSPAAAVENILLAAHALGLGACWVYVKDFDDLEIEQRVKKILGIPKDIEVICQIPIGYSDQKPIDKELSRLDLIVHYERWGN